MWRPDVRLAVTLTQVPPGLREATDRLIATWEGDGRVGRVWQGDASVWTGADEDRWLGWLHVVGNQLADLETLISLQRDTNVDRFERAVLLGMGGSSLCPDVLRQSFDLLLGAPDLQVLDSTDPAQIRTLDEKIRYRRTLFIVSSKSGTTLESTILHSYFADRARQELGGAAGEHFIAVTDPGSALDQVATAEHFRHVFHGVPSIGGRFSALSHFGMVPAAVMGLDVAKLLTRADHLRAQCTVETPLWKNPGAMLGLMLGAAVQAGRDKVTFVISPTYESFGGWLEQLLAESTGKDGRGLIPVDGEVVGAPDVYGDDRVFVYVRDTEEPDGRQDDAVDRLDRAGHPVIRLELGDRYDLGAEFFRWEFATAVVGAVVGINPFDQPDVEASKVETRRLTVAYKAEGGLPSGSPLAREDRLTIYADPANRRALEADGPKDTVEALVRAQLGRIVGGDYVAVLAYIERTPAHVRVLQRIRSALRRAFHVATSVGFGPRFLHSTGQAHKGGQNSGLFFQITCDDARDLTVPGHEFSFGVVKAAQADGDLRVLSERGRRILRVHLVGDVLQGLGRFADLVDRILRDRS